MQEASRFVLNSEKPCDFSNEFSFMIISISNILTRT